MIEPVAMSTDDTSGVTIIVCPICKDAWVHFGPPPPADADAKAPIQARFAGKVLTIAFTGACGHAFTLCLAAHKGQTYMYTEILENHVDAD